MELNKFLEAIKSSCSFLEQDGYSLRKVDISINRNFWYEKQTDTEGFRISFGWTQYGDEFHVKGLLCLKRFNNVEQEMQKFMGDDIIDYYTIHKSPSIDYIPQRLEYTSAENSIKFVLNNHEEIELFCTFVKNFYEESANIFFDHFNNLTSVRFWLANNEIDHHKDLIISWGNTMMVRKLLILKITNAENYLDLYERYKAFLSKKNDENESPYVDMFSFFMKVDTYLSVL